MSQVFWAGEAKLAWLDESIEFISKDHSALKIAKGFINDLTDVILQRNFPVGHLKLLLYYNNKSYKFSFTAIHDANNPEIDCREESNRVLLVVNVRIQCAPGELRTIVADIVGNLQSEHSIDIIENNISFFQPGFPKPTHRFA